VPLLDLLWAMILFFLFIMWIWLVITIFIDIFQSDLSGWGKAGWTIFVVFLPFLGVLIYLIVNGDAMQKRRMDAVVQAQTAQQQYIQQVAGTSSADQLEKLKSLHDQGVLTDDEYAAQKQKVLDS
jgi:hypothetical protein